MSYRAIDLFAGIGGIRLGFQQAFQDDISFVYANDNNKYAAITYAYNYSKFMDTRDINIVIEDMSNVPSHDILLAGFPCQPFSMAGQKEGFKDKMRGTLFFAISRILDEKKPEAFLLENVKHFETHDAGRTWAVVKEALELNYSIYSKVLDASNFGLPQKRERFYIVGFKNPDVSFSFPIGQKETHQLREFLEDDVDPKYQLSQQYLNTLKKHRKRHEAKGHGFGYIVLDPDKDLANTLVVGGMGHERNLIPDKVLEDCWKPGEPTKKRNSEGVRKLTPREYGKLQGFPSDFIIPVSDTQAYKQFANSVPVPVIKAIAKNMKKGLEGHKFKSKMDAYLG